MWTHFHFTATVSAASLDNLYRILSVQEGVYSSPLVGSVGELPWSLGGRRPE